MSANNALTLLNQALSGQASAQHQFIALLTPVIQGQVARVLLAAASASMRRNIRQEVEDLTQQVFERLLAKQAVALRSWSPSGGASLNTYVATIARNVAVSTLRGRRSPWRDAPTESERLERCMPPAQSIENRVVDRQLVHRAFEAVDRQSTPLGRKMLRLLFIEDLTVPEIAVKTELNASAIYQWRSRLTRYLRKEINAMMLDLGPEMRK